jgi:hypothetical protein
MGYCGLRRMAQVHGYAVMLICELPAGDLHKWHWDATFTAEWAEPNPQDSKPVLEVRTTDCCYNHSVLS